MAVLTTLTAHNVSGDPSPCCWGIEGSEGSEASEGRSPPSGSTAAGAQWPVPPARATQLGGLCGFTPSQFFWLLHCGGVGDPPLSATRCPLTALSSFVLFFS